ncbi:MAG: hypothetical protein LBQ49_01220 [Rickettsiales bacterium]|nr:hypothetical protein [Rickettsiales bacterium]
MPRTLFSALISALFVAPLFASTVAPSGRGNQAAATAYRQTQRNYYMVTQPDIDSACRTRIYKCLSDYCGDVTMIPGGRGGQCDYATESDLYTWTLMCLRRDSTALLPQYSANTQYGRNGMNTAAQLCPSYIQSELISYLSLANMAEQLALSRSDDCIRGRMELAAALSCHQVALTYGNGTQNRLVSQLTDYCGPGISGGSSAMVQKFATAGNLGANVLGWAEKLVSMDLSNKGPEWQTAVDQILAHYTNRMNAACGANTQMTTATKTSGGTSNNYPTLTTIANLALDTYSISELEEVSRTAMMQAPEEKIWNEIYTMSEVYDFSMARQIVNAALTNSPLTQNAFLSSAQMASMQKAYVDGAKLFILRDGARCFTVPVRAMTATEQSTIAQVWASCAFN